jgi:hypothetical protein
MAMSANGEWLDQFEEGDASGGHPGEVEAIPRPAASPSMTSRRFPAPWRADKIPGGYASAFRPVTASGKPALASFMNLSRASATAGH